MTSRLASRRWGIHGRGRLSKWTPGPGIYNQELVTNSNRSLRIASPRSPHSCRARFKLVCVLVLTQVLSEYGFAIGQQKPSELLQNAPSERGADVATRQDSDPVAEARLLVERGHLDQAERILRDYLQVRENSADAHYLLGYIYFQQIHEQLQPPSTPQSNPPGPETVDPHFREAKATDSLAELRQAAKYRDPGPFDMKVAALDYILLKDYPNADKWLTHSLESNPDDSDGWYYLGRTKYKENRFAEAAEAFRRFLKLVPGSVKGEDNLGLAYQGLGRTDDAIRAYSAAIRGQKDSLLQDAGPFLDLGVLLLEQNRSEQSVAYLQQAVAVAPEDARGHEQLGKAYDRLGQLTKAQSELEKASELSPQNPRLHYLLGRVYQREGLEDKAKNEFDRSEALKRTSPSQGNEE